MDPVTRSPPADAFERVAAPGVCVDGCEFLALLDGLPDLVTLHDLHFDIVWANAAARRELGLSEAEGMPRRRCFQAYHGTPCPPVGCPSCRTLVDGQARVFERYEPHLHRTIEVRVMPRRDRQGELIGLVHVVRDVPERAHPEAGDGERPGLRAREPVDHEEAGRHDLDLRLQWSQRLESLRMLAGGVAHAFNNLLAVMLGNLEIVLADTLPESPRGLLASARSAGRRAADLTNQLLAYSGRHPLARRVTTLGSLVRESEPLLAASVAPPARLVLEPGGGDLQVEADPVLARQVLVNLVMNASEALEGGAGQVTVRTGPMTADRGFLEECVVGTDLAPGRYAFVEVEDDGTGMEASTLERVLDPFFTTRFMGRGLGLAAVAGIVRSHQGAIHITSVPAQGSRFRVLFPLASSPQPPAAAAAPVGDGAVAHGPGARILVVDDEALVRGVIRRVLERAGYAVVEAENGQEAVAFLAREPNGVVAAILDVMMPVMGGARALVELHRIRPDLPVLLASGYPEQDAVPAGEASQVFCFLPKPFDLGLLVRKVGEASARAVGPPS